MPGKRKKIKMRWILLALLMVFLGLSQLPVMEIQKSGMENFSPADSSLGLSANLFPGEDFPERFEYIDGDYQFYYDGRLEGGYSVSFSYITYAPEQYEAAKEYCICQFSLTDKHQYRVGDYTFIEHLWITEESENGERVPACRYPEYFNMFAFSDSDRTLLFLGYYDDNDALENLAEQPALTDFEAFYNQHYAQYYSLEG